MARLKEIGSGTWTLYKVVADPWIWVSITVIVVIVISVRSA